MCLGDASVLLLVKACLETCSADAWARLIRRVQPAIAGTVSRVTAESGRVDRSEIDDIVQEVFLKLGAGRGELLKRLPADSEQGAIAYLKVTAANVARDYLRAKRAEKRGPRQVVAIDAPFVELADSFPSKSIEKKVLIDEIDKALDADQRERAIFWLYYRQGLTAKEIAGIRAVGLTVKGVESLIHRLTLTVRGVLARRPENPEKGESPAEAF
jgi:RNA polymerase sigma factor (sigma-70 family)